MTRPAENPAPRWKRSSIGETAKGAAMAVKPKTPNQRARALAFIEEHGPATPERIFAALKAEGVKCVLTSIRPRCTELARMGLIADSGQREPGEGGQPAIKWRRTSEFERVCFRTAKAEAEREARRHGR